MKNLYIFLLLITNYAFGQVYIAPYPAELQKEIDACKSYTNNTNNSCLEKLKPEIDKYQQSIKESFNNENKGISLVVEGNVNIEKLELKNNDSSYKHVLAVNENGKIIKKSIADIKSLVNEDKNVEIKEAYNQSNDSQNKEIDCGNLKFRYSANNIPQFALKEYKTNITIYFLRIRKNDNDGKNAFFESFLFDNSNFRNIDPDFKTNNLEEVLISYPDEESFYRVEFISRKIGTINGVDNNIYTIICEKF